ncbi:cadherin-like beta sandwich domain-containing protein, partial [Vescimonas sp.]|uniref:cadherin-like beta sandwich domain-containing protein n=1 Tax=Vescimonas sp. TaxID=2892404 RepID=UPI00307C33E9
MKKRIISLLLALIMALSLLPVSVLAADDHTGQVHVTVENTTWAKADGAPWEGTLLDEWVTLKDDSTMMSCIVDALTAKGYSQTGADTGYISSINGIEEKAAAKGSGWMGTLNDWFTGEGFANYTVANGKLKAGDEIAVQHTCDYGVDIGGSFDTSDKSLKAVALSAGELSPAFSSGVHDYTMILPESVTTLTVTPTASNKQNRVRIYAGNTEYRRMDAIPVQVGTVITLKVGNDGDAAPETYTIALQAAGTLLSGDNVSLTSIHQDGSRGTEVALTFDEGSSAFSGNLAYYTQRKQYNDGGFTVTLSGLPEGATAQLKDSTGKVLADFVNGTASTGSTVVAGSGAANFYFYIAVTAQGRTETYKLTLSKKSEYWMIFKFPLADYNPEISYYGQPEGTLFQADENGNRTGQIGYSKTCWNYIVYISPSISQLNAVEAKTLKFSNMNFNVTPNINGEAYCGINKKLFTQAFQTLKRNPIKIQNDKTVIDFVLDSDNTRAKRENIELHTTITVVVVKTTPEELTAFVDALPDISSLVYSEHYTVVQSYNRAYRGYTDQEKARLSAETVKKLLDSVARMEVLKKRHEDGIQAWANLVNTFAGKVTAENYAQYYDAVKDSEAMYLKLSDAQRKEIDKTEQKTAYDAAFKVVTEQSILDGSSIGKPTNYPDDFMMTSLFFNLDLGHKDTYYPAVFREIWTNRPKSLYPKYTQEKGLPYTLPGILQFEIKDESIFEIKEVEETYKDGGLGGGSTYPAMKYYLVPKKAGTTTFTVTFTDKAGNFYGQIPEIPVHVNSPEESAIADLRNNLTNFTSLGKTSKYDTWTYDYGAEGAEFTFRVNGQNPKVSVYNYLQYNADGTPVVTTYTPDEKGNVTILLKDGYNGIEVTADYQGHTVTQVYSLKGKVTRYVQENISRPGEALRTGDTAGIWIIGKPVELHKILRIYNMGGSPTFRTDMYLSNIADTDRAFNVHWYDRSWNDVFGYSRIAAVLTEAGEVRLTDGYSIYRGYGSAPGSEGDQGNTGGIADSTAFPFGKYADIVLQVKENENYQLQPKYESVASNGGVVKAGEEITVSVPTLPIEQEAEQKYLMHVTLNFATTIPGAEDIKSTWNRGTDSWGSGGTTAVGPEVALKNITFTVPKTTPAGTYRIYGGYLDATYRNGGEAYLDSYDYLYEREIGDLTITVTKGDIETVEDLIDAIGADVTLDSEAAITAAKSAYDALSDEDKALVDADKVDALNAAIIKLNRLKHADLMASLDTIYKTTGDFMSKLGTPTVNSTGGEWMVIGLARSGRTVPAGYYDNVVEYVKAKA